MERSKRSCHYKTTTYSNRSDQLIIPMKEGASTDNQTVMLSFGSAGVTLRLILFFFFQAEDGIRDGRVTGVQTCALPIFRRATASASVSAAFRRHRAKCRADRRIRFLRDVPLRRDKCAPGCPGPRHPIIRRSEERRVGKECRSRWSPKH